MIPRAVGSFVLVAGFAACSGGSSLTAVPTNSIQPQAAGRVALANHDDPDCKAKREHCIARVLLISLDGMHAIDLEKFVATHPNSALASLSDTGVTYTEAHAPVPTDSFPGLLALVTGGHPASTGVYYEVSFDRSLYPPNSNCKGAPGTKVAFDESIDFNPNVIDGGGGINPATLTQQLANGVCTHVFPHDYLRVNTIFEVVKANGGRTAWSDKEQSYEMLNGPSGKGVDDLYNREIAAGGTTGSLTATENYDDSKVLAILNEIDGKSSRGVPGVGVPTLFGMNFQAVSVGQKLAIDPTTGLPGGYVDAAGTPNKLLEGALEHTDASLGKILAELARRDLAKSTLVVISAKHGQAPIDIHLRRGIGGAGTAFANALAQNIGNGFVQTDDLALIWLQNRSEDNERSALANLRSIAVPLGFESGTIFTEMNRPAGYGRADDPRAPDFSIEPDRGVIYTSGTKIAEHGGFFDEDTHVALLVSNPGLKHGVVTRPVQTAQVAPTIIEALHIGGHRLQAVAAEGTDELPDLDLDR